LKNWRKRRGALGARKRESAHMLPARRSLARLVKTLAQS